MGLRRASPRALLHSLFLAFDFIEFRVFDVFGFLNIRQQQAGRQACYYYLLLSASGARAERWRQMCFFFLQTMIGQLLMSKTHSRTVV